MKKGVRGKKKWIFRLDLARYRVCAFARRKLAP